MSKQSLLQDMPGGWLEISLTVDGEMAEAVAEVLSRFIPGGVVIESTQIETDPEDEGRPVGPLRVCGYLPMDERLEETRHKLEEALWFLDRIRQLPTPSYRSIQEVDWSEAWKEHYRPISIGRTLIIIPAWLEPPDTGRIPVKIDPGMAFGTGTHPTTQLCLELLEEACLGGPPQSMIDVGCGSGILSIASLKLGAKRALGVDIDPQALAAARQNADLNGVTDRLELGLGSVACAMHGSAMHGGIISGEFSLRQAQLVVANILAPVLSRLFAEGLGDLVAPQGSLVLSGILEEQLQEDDPSDLLNAIREHGFHIQTQKQAGDWIALLAVR